MADRKGTPEGKLTRTLIPKIRTMTPSQRARAMRKTRAILRGRARA